MAQPPLSLKLGIHGALFMWAEYALLLVPVAKQQSWLLWVDQWE